MEAKDTVMSEEQISNIPINEDGEPMVLCSEDFKQEYRWVAQAQAEISFKAGGDQGYRNGYIDGYNTAKQEAVKAHFEGLATGRKAGMREVVEWIMYGKMSLNRENIYRGEANGTMQFLIPRKDWQAKLKEWFKDNSELLEEWGV